MKTTQIFKYNVESKTWEETELIKLNDGDIFKAVYDGIDDIETEIERTYMAKGTPYNNDKGILCLDVKESNIDVREVEYL